MADEGFDMLSAEDQAKLDKLNKKEELAGGLSEEEKAKIAEEAEGKTCKLLCKLQLSEPHLCQLPLCKYSPVNYNW